jgi:hypothetical protein
VEITPFQHHRIFRCKCKNQRDYNWILDGTIINEAYPVGYWMYINDIGKFHIKIPLNYRFVFR